LKDLLLKDVHHNNILIEYLVALRYIYAVRLDPMKLILTINYIQTMEKHSYINAKAQAIEIVAVDLSEASTLYNFVRQSINIPDKKPFLVLINPYGGDGKAFKSYEKTVRPMLEDSGVNHVLISTEYRLHAQLITHDMDLKLYSGLLVVGGDGLMHECVNGLLSRKDWSQINKFPIGLIPAGTSNAVARSVGIADPVYAVFSAIRGATQRFDGVIYEQGEHRFYGHFACMFGLVADIDLGADAWRCIGRGRLACSTLWRLIHLQSYHAEISYIGENVSPPNIKIKSLDRPPMRYKSLFTGNDSRVKTIEEAQYYSFLAVKFPYLDRDGFLSHRVQIRSGTIDLLMLPRKSDVTRWALFKSFLYSDGSTVFDDPTMCQHQRVRACMLRFRMYEGALLDVDGEEVPSANIYFECLPDALCLIVPPKSCE
jgi:sphingosine kinase